MRVTSSMYYKNLYAENNKVAKELFDVTKQISSGEKIQYAYEDTDTFVKTVQLDNEIATLEQAQESSNSGLKFSTNTDTTMNEFTSTLQSFKVKLLQAANNTNSPASLDAVAVELDSLREHLVNLANTSIDGQFLFSGTSTSTKPISSDGSYNGNDGDMFAFLGNEIKQKYNISGADLFLGEEKTLKREIATNIALKNAETGEILSSTDSILDLMEGNSGTQNFYIRGFTHDGSSVKEHIILNDGDSIDDLFGAIENIFGSGKVDVSLDKGGQIHIEDKLQGSSKLDFHIVGNTGAAVSDIDALVPPIKEFMKSGLVSSGSVTAAEAAVYDRTDFERDGASLVSNVPQIMKEDNGFATDSTKLSDVFSSVTSSVLHLEGMRRDGAAPYNIDIVFGADPANDPVQIQTGSGNYQVSDGLGNTTVANEMTYRQFMDVINMAVNGEVPSDSGADYQASIKAANSASEVTMSHDGRIVFEDKQNPVTLASISVYDSNSQDFSNTDGPIAVFNANNALMLRDPKTDFFARIDEVIASVREGKSYADAGSGDPRNSGIQSGIQMIDDLMDHVGRQHTQAGGQSQALERANERNDTLILSSMTLRAEVIDTDLAEASLRLQQLSLNYEAMLSSVSRISSLSLVNYL